MGWSVLIAILAITLLAPSATATERSTAGRVIATSDIDGWKGVQGIRTDPATASGVGYVHQTQMDIGSPANAFVAIGTAKGAGVPGTTCANDNNPLWTVYVDGEIGGVYVCDDVDVNAFGAGDTPAFNITYNWCPSASGNRWLMSFEGVLWTCLNAGVTAAVQVTAGLETTGTSSVDRNIDVKYTNLERNMQGSTTWVNLVHNLTIVNPNYDLDIVNNRAHNAYLAPLD
jgi:hypothetical protein